MKIKVLSVMLVFLLSACAKDKIVYVDRFIEIPKVVFKDFPTAVEIETPEYFIEKIDKDSSDDEVLNAIIITLNQQSKLIKKQAIALKPYQEQDNAERRRQNDK